MSKTLKSIHTQHLVKKPGENMQWFKSGLSEIILTLSDDDQLLSFQITDEDLNLRYQRETGLIAGKVERRESISDKGKLKYPASNLILHENKPTLDQVAKAMVLLAATPSLAESALVQIKAVLETNQAH